MTSVSIYYYWTRVNKHALWTNRIFCSKIFFRNVIIIWKRNFLVNVFVRKNILNFVGNINRRNISCYKMYLVRL